MKAAFEEVLATTQAYLEAGCPDAGKNPAAPVVRVYHRWLGGDCGACGMPLSRCCCDFGV